MTLGTCYIENDVDWHYCIQLEDSMLHKLIINAIYRIDLLTTIRKFPKWVTS